MYTKIIFPSFQRSETVVKLAPRDETSPIRTFYLRLSTGEEAEAWAHAIRGTRFDYVREERDALRVAKNGLADQVRIRSAVLLLVVLLWRAYLYLLWPHILVSYKRRHPSML